MIDAEAGRFEVVDRLGRKFSDVADLFDRLTFRRIAVHAAWPDQMTQMHVDIIGTMAQMTLSDPRGKTRRSRWGLAAHHVAAAAYAAIEHPIEQRDGRCVRLSGAPVARCVSFLGTRTRPTQAWRQSEPCGNKSPGSSWGASISHSGPARGRPHHLGRPCSQAVTWWRPVAASR